ncbi:g2527 [Coccomyxa viridis]|uniref:G2527 protein n=1 Tax=Coccomyxa viridis TaxID=1274662 RepID=A0ABP1FQS9_9CHLO
MKALQGKQTTHNQQQLHLSPSPTQHYKRVVPSGHKKGIRRAANALAAVAAPDALAAPAVSLSPSLRRDTAVLQVHSPAAPGGKTQVYILGVSHVSRESCQEIQELIQAVRPDVVLLELCKDRLRLLLDQENSGKQLWHTPRVPISGLPKKEHWPKAQQLVSLLRCQPGGPVATQDIEADCNRLLETGLFARVRPKTQLPLFTQAPNYLRDRDGHLNPVIPLNQVEFEVLPRVLPKIQSFDVRVDSSLGEGSAIPAEVAESLAAEAMSIAAEDGNTSTDVCLRMLPQVHEAASKQFPGQDIEVAFRGIEMGSMEALLKAASPEYRSRPYSSGLEDSAVGGRGLGMEPFKPNRGPLKLSENMIIENLAKVLDIATETVDSIADVSNNEEHAELPNDWRTWSADETQEAFDTQGKVEEETLSQRFAALLTGLYAQQQTAAAEKCGVSGGESWRVAFESASNNGARQVLLGDVPANVSSKRLGDGVLQSALINLGIIVAAAAATVGAEVTHKLPEGSSGLAAAAVGASALLAAAPLFSPLVQIWLLARKSKDDIENTVRVKAPLQADLERPVELWGEDALLQWPGARRPLIQERDAYMARTIWAAASGLPASPAYIKDRDQGRTIWRYTMPEGGPEEATPPGNGEGEYKPAQAPGKLVAVVGSAHVRGILREWEKVSHQEYLKQLQGILKNGSKAS